MNQQVLRILSLLPYVQLLSMHEEAVDALNHYDYNNCGRDDIGGDIAKTIAEMSSDVKHLESAVHNAYLEKQIEHQIEELPF